MNPIPMCICSFVPDVGQEVRVAGIVDGVDDAVAAVGAVAPRCGCGCGGGRVAVGRRRRGIAVGVGEAQLRRKGSFINLDQSTYRVTILHFNNLPLTWFWHFQQLMGYNTAQAGWRNIPNLSQLEVITILMDHTVSLFE